MLMIYIFRKRKKYFFFPSILNNMHHQERWFFLSQLIHNVYSYFLLIHLFCRQVFIGSLVSTYARLVFCYSRSTNVSENLSEIVHIVWKCSNQNRALDLCKQRTWVSDVFISFHTPFSWQRIEIWCISLRRVLFDKIAKSCHLWYLFTLS